MADLDAVYLRKADDELQCAEAEHSAGRYGNCANRCYYACFHAAISALLQAGVLSASQGRPWRHGYIQAEFAGRLIGRRKLYPSEFADVLTITMHFRERADYTADFVTEHEAARALRRSRQLVAAIRTGRGGQT